MNSQTITAHHQDPIYFSLSRAELDQLKDKARVPEKENFFFLLGLFIPSLLNLINGLPVESGNGQSINWLFNLNLLIVIVTFIMSIFQAKAWFAKRSSFKEFMEDLEARPRVDMLISGTADQYVKTTKQPAEN